MYASIRNAVTVYSVEPRSVRPPLSSSIRSQARSASAASATLISPNPAVVSVGLTMNG